MTNLKEVQFQFQDLIILSCGISDVEQFHWVLNGAMHLQNLSLCALQQFPSFSLHVM